MLTYIQAAPPPSRKQGTVRGRRDVRNTIFVPTPEASAIASSLPAEPATSSAPLAAPGPSSPPGSLQSSPFKGVTPSQFATNEDRGASDAQSVRSGRSLASTASAIRHPELHEPGLNSSIVESVSATFEQGSVTKAMVVGEVALAYNSSGTTPSTENIRLDNFAILEKVAPNPACIHKGDDKDGYYTVQPSLISRTTVAFKYQVHHDEPASLGKHAPLVLTPQWKVEPTQTSAIVKYSLNPDLPLPAGTTSINLANVALVLHLDPSGPKATNTKVDKGGTFMRERSAVLWRLGDITLTKDAPAQQLRARFYTETEAKPGSLEARWEISGESAGGLGSGLDVSILEAGEKAESDPFADEDSAAAPVGENWKRVKGVRGLRSGGTYNAM